MRHRPFVRAFTEWFARSTDLHDILVVEPHSEQDAIEISFQVGVGALRGYAHSIGVTVSAMRDEECYDFIFDQETVVADDENGYFCSLCSVKEPDYFASVEGLWEDHLLEPLHRWVDEVLRSAAVLELFQQGGMSWARLRQPDEVADIPQAAFVISLQVPS